MFGTYRVPTICTNCGAEGFTQVPRGLKVSNVTCPYCACATMELRQIPVTEQKRMSPAKIGIYHEANPPEALAEDVKEDIEPCP